MKKENVIQASLLLIGLVVGFAVGSMPLQSDEELGSIQVMNGYVSYELGWIPISATYTPINGTYEVNHDGSRLPFPSFNNTWNYDRFNITIHPYGIATSVNVEVDLSTGSFVWSNLDFMITIES